MRVLLHRAAALLLAAVAVCFVLPSAARAEDPTADVTVPVNASEKIRVEVTPVGGAPAPDPTVVAVATPDSANADFPYKGEISFSGLMLGDYEYLVAQIREDDVPYDDTVWRLQVSVIEEGNVKVTIVVNKVGESVKPAQITFGWPPVEIDPPIRVKKTVDGSPTVASPFTFILRPVRNNAGYAKEQMPMPGKTFGGEARVTLTGPGEHEFGKFTFTRPGVYEYEIVEEKGSAAGYTYDTVIYKLTYTVTPDGGNLNATREMVNTQSQSADVCLFVNTYKPPQGKDTSPKTGDATNQTLWETVTVASLAGFVFFGLLLFFKERRDDRDDNLDHYDSAYWS